MPAHRRDVGGARQAGRTRDGLRLDVCQCTIARVRCRLHRLDLRQCTHSGVATGAGEHTRELLQLRHRIADGGVQALVAHRRLHRLDARAGMV